MYLHVALNEGLGALEVVLLPLSLSTPLSLSVHLLSLSSPPPSVHPPPSPFISCLSPLLRPLLDTTLDPLQSLLTRYISFSYFSCGSLLTSLVWWGTYALVCNFHFPVTAQILCSWNCGSLVCSAPQRDYSQVRKFPILLQFCSRLIFRSRDSPLPIAQSQPLEHPHSKYVTHSCT